MQTVIMAGGKGTRLTSITNDEIPKPMVNLCGKPLIEHLIEQLSRNAIRDIIICLGHLGKQISDYLGDGTRYGVDINYVYEEKPLGTAGALYYAKQYIYDTFLLIYADLLEDVDWNRMLNYHNDKQAKCTMLVHPNSHPYDSDLVVHDDSGVVTALNFKDHIRDYDYENCVNAGAVIFDKSVLNYCEKLEKISLEKDLIQHLIQNKEKVLAYSSPEYIKDVGTPERLAVAECELESGKIANRNLSRKQKAVFIDRDGTINIYKGLITSPKHIELIPGVADAIRKLNESEYMVLVVTNQPVVARGDCTEADVDSIHRRIYTLLGNEGSYVDDFLYCPHHTDKGFPGERSELKFDCDCRKPKIGMIKKFVDKYNIDLDRSWMVGDTYRDVQTGKNAGLKTILIHSSANDEHERFDVQPDYCAGKLTLAVQMIFNER